ncbi:hypothetical protein [Flammeovirga aprica]|uniref:Uncharacterized protein n=1 Tax=Flammeovirga aprica JL-4 TaxID=694437 RepID=A0A7X9XDD1_9BACT|nr:hypothetical protein [Flammeovirga aprica]NME72776.1 hypothetical protein [Flammeovirga aprica JL-4]
MRPANLFFDMLEGVWQNKLNDQWQDNWGWNFITQPDFENRSFEDFHTGVDPMRETMTFKKIGSARNIGEVGEAGFWQSMAYEIDIRNHTFPDPKNPDGKGIHHEMGHFLLQVDSLEDDADAIVSQRGSDLSGVIIRQATIPRANSFMTHGRLDIESVGKALENSDLDSFYSARTISTRSDLQEKIDIELSDKAIQAGAPNPTKLVSLLKQVDEESLGTISPGTQDWVFSFRFDRNPSQMASGQRVNEPVGIDNLLSDFWIGKRMIDGQEREILQYTQKVNLIFNGQKWPHVAVNTLIKQL